MKKLLTSLAALTMVAAPVQAQSFSVEFAIDHAKAFCLRAQSGENPQVAYGGAMGMTQTKYNFNTDLPFGPNFLEMSNEELVRVSNEYSEYVLRVSNLICPSETLELRQITGRN